MTDNRAKWFSGRLIIAPVLEPETSGRALASIERGNDQGMIGIVDILIGCAEPIFRPRPYRVPAGMARAHFHFLGIERGATLKAIGHAIKQPFLDKARH